MYLSTKEVQVAKAETKEVPKLAKSNRIIVTDGNQVVRLVGLGWVVRSPK